MSLVFRQPVHHTFFSLKATTGAGTAFKCENFRHLILSIATDGGADAALTVKIQGSIQDTEPTWASAQSEANMWDYVQIVDLQNGAEISGDTGFVVATADDYRLFEVNTNGLKWINANVTARSQGEVTAKLLGITM